MFDDDIFPQGDLNSMLDDIEADLKLKDELDFRDTDFTDEDDDE